MSVWILSPRRRLLPRIVRAVLSTVLLAGMFQPATEAAEEAANPSLAEQATRAAGGDNPAGDSASADQSAAETTDLGKVVVHTHNRLQALQDVPTSVSVVTGTELDRLDAFDIQSITRRLGNISWNLGNQRTSSLSIRGIGMVGQTEAQDPSVGVVVDGVSYAYNPMISSYDFTDLDTAQVLRGPQGTLGGKNATVGVVNLTTRAPSFTPDAEYSVTIGQLNTVIGHAAGGGPVIDDLLAWRGSLSVQKGQGDVVNLYNRDQTYTNTDRVTGRIQFLLTPTPDINARVIVEKTPRGGETTNGRTINTPTPTVYSNGTINTLSTDAATRLSRSWFTQDPSYSYAGTYLYGAGLNAVDNNAQQPLVTGSSGATAIVNWSIDTLTLTSTGAYRDYHFDAVNDEGTPFDILRNAGGFWNAYEQLSEELRLSSQTGGLVDYQTGIYLLKTHNSDEYRKDFGEDAGAWFATASQYNQLNVPVNPDGSVSGGHYLLQNSLDGVNVDFNAPAGLQDIQNRSYAVFGQADWHVTRAFTVTTGLRLTREDRQTVADSLITDNGNAPELNPVAINGVAEGGFASNTKTGALIAGANSPAQLGLADLVANRYFGVPLTTVPGAAYGMLTPAQLLQVADAKAIRLAQVGVLFGSQAAQPFRKTQPGFVISPSYKLSDSETAYVSWQYGEKAGISQFVNGISNLVAPEKNTSYEIGLKSALLNKTLTVDADVYLTNIRNYQQAVRVFDPYTTNLNVQNGVLPSTAYVSATGNVPKVQSKGIELDAVYVGIPDASIRLSGAYVDAFYKDFPNSAQPVENGYAGAPPYQNVTGQILPGASRVTANLGVDYRYPIFNGNTLGFSLNTAFNSRFNSDPSLSSYAWVPASTITDIEVGFGRRDNSFQAGLLVKNLLNDGTHLSQTWDSYTPPIPRWIGFVASGKL